MNQNKSNQKQTGYPGSGLTNQTAQEPDFSENAPEASAFRDDAPERNSADAAAGFLPETDSLTADQPDNDGYYHE